MRWVLERVSEPEIEPVSLAEARRHLKSFDGVTVDDADITALITGGRQWVEHETGRALIDQEWKLTLTDEFATADTVQSPSCICGVAPVNSEILLRRSPMIEIVSFATVDAAGDETAIDADTYELREENSKWPKLVGLSGASWGTGTFRIVMRAGYADQQISPQQDVSAVPVSFRQAIKLWVEANYYRAANMQTLLDTASGLIAKEVCHTGFA